jgi:hypothetical protein
VSPPAFKLKQRENPMKKISYVLLLLVAVTTLAACGEQGVGPSKPGATQESAK